MRFCYKEDISLLSSLKYNAEQAEKLLLLQGEPI